MRYFLYAFGLPFSASEFEVGNNYMVGESEAKNSAAIGEILERSIRKLDESRYRFHSKKVIHLDDAVPAFLRSLVPRCYYKIYEESTTEWPKICTVYHVPEQPEFEAAVYTYTVDSSELKTCRVPEFISTQIAVGAEPHTTFINLAE